MTTVNIPGTITAIEYANSFAVVSLSDGKDGIDPPTLINPSGVKTTIVIATNTPFGGSGFVSGFVMSPDFNVGDTVEIYLLDNGFGSLKVFDENGNVIIDGKAPGSGVICRKILTGSGKTWGRTD